MKWLATRSLHTNLEVLMNIEGVNDQYGFITDNL